MPHGLGAQQSPPDARDFPIARLYAAPIPVIPPTYLVASPLPPQLDQGNTPMCVAYSTAAMKLYEDSDEGPWTPDELLFFGRIGGGPNGAYPRNAMKELLANGYPPGESAHKVQAYYSVPVVKADIQLAILSFGPLVLGMDWYNAWFRPVSGVLGARDSVAGGHAILAIGWDERGLRLRNSWGSKFGANGDCFLPWAYLNSVWEAWKAVDQPEPVFVAGPEVTMHFVRPAPRICDGPISALADHPFQIAGKYGIPAEATGVAAIIRVDRSPLDGWVAIGPLADPGDKSTLDYNRGQITDGYPHVELDNGVLHVWSTRDLPRFILDITGFYL